MSANGQITRTELPLMFKSKALLDESKFVYLKSSSENFENSGTCLQIKS